MATTQFPIEKTDEEWRRILTPQQYGVLRQHGTEPAGSCALLHEHREGTFACAGCGQLLFRTGRKFESGTGWPSFFSPVEGAVG
jgi:peptide-methionine (R)-S-oxide reductase